MKKAFVIIDYQNDFISGNLGFQKALLIEKNIRDLLKTLNFKTTDLLITFDTHSEEYLQSKEGKMLPIKHCIKDTWGWQMPDAFKEFIPRARKIFYKNSFGSLEFAKFIAENSYEEIHFCGLVSHICVFHNILLAFNANLNAKLILHQKATASFDENLQNAAFELLKAFGVEIW